MYTLLIVEDDVNQQRLYAKEFTEEGYRVVSAMNGTEALTCLEQDPPDIVVLDLVMPVIDGIEILERFVIQAPQLPIVINTAYSDYQTNYLTWSADAYVVKSSDLTELKKALRTVLSKRNDADRNSHE